MAARRRNIPLHIAFKSCQKAHEKDDKILTANEHSPNRIEKFEFQKNIDKTPVYAMLKESI